MPNLDFSKEIQLASKPEDIEVIIKELGFKNPGQLSKLFLKFPLKSKNLLRKSQYNELCKLLNLGIELNTDRKKFTVVSYSLPRNNYWLFLSVKSVEFIAVLRDFTANIPITEDYIKRAWFSVKPKMETKN